MHQIDNSISLEQHTCLVKYRLEAWEEYKETFTLRMGMDGLCLVMDDVPECNRVCSLRLYLPIYNECLDMSGQIVSMDGDSRMASVYITYMEISEEDRQKLYRYVKLVKEAENRIMGKLAVDAEASVCK